MVAYSFKPRFVDPMLKGIKDGTIRTERRHPSRHAMPGDPVTNYIGLRTKRAELILRTVCVASLPVTLMWRPKVAIVVDDTEWREDLFNQFARRDGFQDFNDMAAFWREVHPGVDRFVGRLIRWQPPKLGVEMGATVAVPERRAA